MQRKQTESEAERSELLKRLDIAKQESEHFLSEKGALEKQLAEMEVRQQQASE
jgi:VIT1/CCC1 family predicted Fe2+/Mn2+ transporter